MLALIDGENARDGHLFLADEVEICWEERLGTALLEKSKSPTLKPQILASILEYLLQREFPGARDAAESRVDASLSDSGLEESQAVASAQVLLRFAGKAGWAKVWPAMQGKNRLGRAIAESITYGRLGGGINFTANSK